MNLTDKTDYARAEICKFNPCLCIINSSTGIIFFSYRQTNDLTHRKGVAA